ncbi:NlpC/P60 family protein [Leucobacter salsicius]|uniref:NlpC/P60 family protein n=1 Tax=Leucobacter salsicius TaxID=664638 RepID=UPI00036FCBB6|nr:NlpC/P60 family protein [Leucobacter salsicius]
MSFNQSTDLVAATPVAKNATSKAKRVAQMAGAAALSFGLMGTFSIPAYATAPQVEGAPDLSFAAQQSLETVDASSAPLELTAPEGAVDSEILEKERLEAEAKAEAEAAAAAAEKTSAKVSDIPAGVGAKGLVNAALAQVGTNQDCTDLVQNALAAIGAAQRRDQGGYDHGVSDFYQYGTAVTDGNYAPGDILIWPGAPHVAVYIGNGQAVHGGWGGNQTVVNTYASPSATPDVVRLR